MGLALVVGSLLFLLGGLWCMHAYTSWSEGELRSAVHGAARALEDGPQTVSPVSDYEDLIREAVEETGEGPPYGGGLRIRAVGERGDDDPSDGIPRADGFEVGADDVDGVHCVLVSPPEPDAVPASTAMSLSVTVRAGSCQGAYSTLTTRGPGRAP